MAKKKAPFIYNPVTAKLSEMDWSMTRGRRSVENKIRDMYRRNSGDTEFTDELEKLKVRIAGRGGSMHDGQEDIFVKEVMGRLSNPNNAKASEIRVAAAEAMATDIFQERRALSGTFGAIQRLMDSDEWEDFVEASGFDATKPSSFQGMIRDSGQRVTYTNQAGDEFELEKYYDPKLQRVVAHWSAV